MSILSSNLPVDIKKQFMFESVPSEKSSGISIVIPVRGTDRQKNLNYCISSLLLQNIEKMEIIVSEEDIVPKINIDLFRRDSRIKKVFTKSSLKSFNKSIAINVGVSNSLYNKILMNDADIITPAGYLKRIDTILDSYDCCFLGKEIYKVDLLGNSLLWRKKKRVDYFSGGSIAFTKKCFIDIGGMNEQFCGYGSEDCEFWERINKLANIYENRDSSFLHLNHKRIASLSVNADLYSKIVSTPMNKRLEQLKIDLNKRFKGAEIC